MLFFTIIISLCFILSNNAFARVTTVNVNDDANRTKRLKRTSKVAHALSVAEIPHSQRKNGRQSKSTSAVFAKNDFTIQIDPSSGSGLMEKSSAEGAGDAPEKITGQSTYSMSMSPAGGAKAISTSALSRAQATHALKKKLQDANKKKYQLQDVSGEKGKKDPREEILKKLLDVSQDIESSS